MSFILVVPFFSHARILFQNDYFHLISSQGLNIDSDSSFGDVLLKFGSDGTDGLIIWNNLNNAFSVSHGWNISGGLSADGIVDFSDSQSFNIRKKSFGGNFIGLSAPNCLLTGEIALNSDNNKLYVCVNHSLNQWNEIGVSSSANINLDDAYNNFGSSPSTIVVDATQGQTGGLLFDGSLSSNYTMSVKNSADGGALFVENSGMGISFRVNDMINDLTPFVIDFEGKVGVGNIAPQNPLDIKASGDVIRIGNNNAANICIVFDDDDPLDRKFCWDDMQSLFTFSEKVFFPANTGSIPPICNVQNNGQLFFDNDNGMLFVCDASRSKYLSPTDMVLWGENGNDTCGGVAPNLINSAQCAARMGDRVTYRNTNSGFFLPHNITITGVSWSSEHQGCNNNGSPTSGIRLKILRSTGPNDENFLSGSVETVLGTVPTGTPGPDYFNATGLNIDVNGNAYIVFGISPNCSSGLSQWNMQIYYRYRST